MAILRVPALWLLGIARLFPTNVQPGVYLVLVILVIWALTRARKSMWNGLCRLLAWVVDLVVGLLLLLEFALTRTLRASGSAPSPVVLAGGQAAEKVLDTAADVYAAHPLVRVTKRPPLVLMVILLFASGFDYWAIHLATHNGGTVFAHDVWRTWAQFTTWVDG
jgi:hypothetical protein